MQTNGNNIQNIQSNLRTAHDKLMQAQQKIDNRDLNEQRLLEEALDAVNNAQQALSSGIDQLS